MKFYGAKREVADDDEVRDLVARGAHQTSRKFCSIAVLPGGETGLEALRRCDPERHRRIMDYAEHMAADYYLSSHAADEGNAYQLTPEQFELFRKLGGRPI